MTDITILLRESADFLAEPTVSIGSAVAVIAREAAAEIERLRKLVDLHETYLAGIDLARLDDFRKLAAVYAPETAPCPSPPAPTET